MKPDKAIKILADSAYGGTTTFNQEYKEAQILGLEALVLYRNLRHDYPNIVPKLLHGETTDEPTALEQRLKRGNKILALGRKMIKETNELLGKPTSSL